MVYFPDEVWSHILSFRPRDRDCSSPTAAAFLTGTGLVDGREDVAYLRGICPRCGIRRLYVFWCFEEGDFYREDACFSCRGVRITHCSLPPECPDNPYWLYG